MMLKDYRDDSGYSNYSGYSATHEKLNVSLALNLNI